MRVPTKLIILAVIAHLSCVALGAADVSVLQFGPLGKAIEYYGYLSGAGYSYGFFAPGIEGQLRARFELTSADGTSIKDILETGENQESNLRMGNIIDQFKDNQAENHADFQRKLAGSLAGSVFKRHPKATKIKIFLDYFQPTSMAEFRNGTPGKWTNVYEAQFAHSRLDDNE